MLDPVSDKRGRVESPKAQGGDVSATLGDSVLFPRVLLEGEDGEMHSTGMGSLYDAFRAPQVHLENLSRMVTRPEEFGVQKIQACIDYLTEGGVIQPKLPGMVRDFRRSFNEKVGGTEWEAGFQVRVMVVIFNTAVVKYAGIERTSIIIPDKLEIGEGNIGIIPTTGVSFRNLGEVNNAALEGPVYAGQPLFHRTLKLLPGRSLRLSSQVLANHTLGLYWPDSLDGCQSPFLGRSRTLYKMVACRSTGEFELRGLVFPLKYAPPGSCALVRPDRLYSDDAAVISPRFAGCPEHRIMWMNGGAEEVFTMKRGSYKGDDRWVASPDPATAQLRVARRGRRLTIKNEGPALMHLELSGLETTPFRSR